MSSLPAPPPQSRNAEALLAASLVVVCLAVLGLRVFDLSADPASYWPHFTAWGDEGNWNYPAAVAAITGDWPRQCAEQSRLIPLYLHLQRLVFRLLGPGLEQARLLSVVSGALTILALGSLFRSAGRHWALLAAALHGTNFWVLAVDRFAGPESLCILLLTASLIVAVRDERLGGAGFLAALGLCVGAILAKPPAAFGVVALLLYWTWNRSRSSDLPARAAWGRLFLLLFLVTVGLTWAAPLAISILSSSALGQSIAGAARMHGLPLAVRDVVPFLGVTTWARVKALAFYPFVAHMTVPLLGIGALLWPRAWAGAIPGRVGRARDFAVIWVAAWWALVPFTGLRGLRYVLITPALTLLGLIGFLRLVQSRPPEDAAVGASKAPALLYLGWFLASWSAQLADLTGVRARVWFPALALLAALVFAGVRGRIGARLAQGLGGLAIVAILGQLTVFVAWAQSRTHLVIEAQARTSSIGLGGKLLCGRQAAVLLLATPLQGRALDIHYYPSCELAGHRAETAVFARSRECLSTDPRPFLAATHTRLLDSPELARVVLDGWHGSQRLLCEYSVALLPPDEASARGKIPVGTTGLR